MLALVCGVSGVVVPKTQEQHVLFGLLRVGGVYIRTFTETLVEVYNRVIKCNVWYQTFFWSAVKTQEWTTANYLLRSDIRSNAKDNRPSVDCDDLFFICWCDTLKDFIAIDCSTSIFVPCLRPLDVFNRNKPLCTHFSHSLFLDDIPNYYNATCIFSGCYLSDEFLIHVSHNKLLFQTFCEFCDLHTFQRFYNLNPREQWSWVLLVATRARNLAVIEFLAEEIKECVKWYTWPEFQILVELGAWKCMQRVACHAFLTMRPDLLLECYKITSRHKTNETLDTLRFIAL